MDATQPSPKLLAHFDDAPAPADVAQMVSRIGPTRGISWVLKWTTAITVLFYATTVLTEFGYSLAAEQLLAHAARAGVLEATLPRATIKNVEQTVEQQLAGHVNSKSDVKLLLLNN